MTYTIRKKKVGQEVVKKLTFMLNACKYTQAPYTTTNIIRVFSTVFDVNFTGSISTTSVDAGYVALWGGITNLYMRVPLGDGEIIKISITTAGEFNVLERRCFGTPAGVIPAANLTILHAGEVDGSCYGYLQTCSTGSTQVADVFKPIVFATAPLPAGSLYHGGLDFKGSDYSSGELKPGESMGSRSRLSWSISDQIHNDYGMNPYPERRSSAGTLFGKLLARNPFFQGRDVIYSVGLRDAGTLDEPDWEHRTFVIDTASLSNEKFTGSALDPLILTEGKKAKIPLASTAQLVTAITGASTSVTFGNAVAGHFGTSGNVIIRIESELLQVTANGTTTMPIVTRGFGGTVAKDHAINVTVQNCIRFVDEHMIDCITYAISTWTEAGAYLDDYTETKALIPNAIITDYVISSPMDVAEFINKLIFAANLVFYFDDLTGKIVIKYVSEFSLSPILITESDHIKKGSVKKDSNLKEYFTRFNLSWAPYDLTKETDQKNQQLSLTAVNTLLELPYQVGEVNERKAMIIPFLTNSTDDYIQAAATVNRVVSVTEAPEILELELDAEQIGGDFELGAIVSVYSSENQSKSGQPEARLYQVLKISGDPFESFKVKMKRYQLLEPSDVDFTVTAGTYINYVLTDHYDPVGAGEYVVYVENGAIFGSNDTSLPAFKTGTPNAGVTFKFIARWQVLAMGGAGGDSGIYGTAPTDGQDGGTAFEAGCDCVIDNSSGLIFAGGGGRGASGYSRVEYSPYDFFSPSAGGNGGQGFGESLGGLQSSGSAWNGTYWEPHYHDERAPNGNQSGVGLSDTTGGRWGENGGNGTDDGNDGQTASQGGLAGVAIKSNGFNVTIISGDNALSIRGRRT